MGLKFGAGMAIAAAAALGMGATAPAPTEPEPPRRKQPKRITLVDRIYAQMTGGLAGDAFVTSIESPKPLGKRAKRRLRGRNKEALRVARARLANYIWEF